MKWNFIISLMANNEDISDDKTSIVTNESLSGKLRASESPPALVVLMGPTGYLGKQWLLTQTEYLLGRSIECPIFLDDKSVSRNHAKISIIESDVVIYDLGSANKTIVNGSSLESMRPHKLKNNDQIKVGSIIMKFLEKGNLEAFAHQQLNEKVNRDPLTGAYSKGSLMEKGPEAIKRAEVLNEELCVLMFDIDFFKKVNDTYGHDAGDYILKELSKIISTKLVRAHDFFARYGGEEFVILLIGSPLKAASEVAERIRTTVEAYTFFFNNIKIPITISIGLTRKLANENDWNVLFKRADEALYVSKQSGRNRVTVSA